MEDVFRFLLARPVQLVETDTVRVSPSPDYHEKLKRARSSEDPPAVLKSVALEHSRSPAALRSIGELKHGTQVVQFLTTLGAGTDRTLNEVTTVVTNTFGSTPKKIAASEDFRRDRARLGDVIVTNAILGRDGAVSSYDAARLLRAMAIVERTGTADAGLEEKGGIAEALGRTLLLPEDVFPIRDPGSRAVPTSVTPAAPERDTRREAELHARRDALLATYTTLTRVAPEGFVAPAGEKLRPDVLTESREGRPGREDFPPVTPSIRERAAETARSEAPISSDAAAFMTEAPLMLKREVVAALGERQKAVLAERNLDLSRVSLPSAVDRLSMELQQTEAQIAELREAGPGNMMLLGGTYMDAAVSYVGNIFPGMFLPQVVPTTHGSVAPAGIGDLLVVKQFLKRYEARELAHIENILKGEYKERMHRRQRTTEETITVETEVKREEERDLQTTERFELKTEASQVQKEDTSLKIGLAVSGKYGPVVEFKATTDFALNTSKEEATKVATSYSKDVTSRATSRIFERRREERILKTIEVFEEKNTHGIDNKLGTDHVVGQYQWIDKVYEAQVFNYGKRLLFDIMVPEPAAFLLHATSSQPKAGAALVKPAPFTLTPLDISEWNYGYYVKQYQVSGVTPPPQPYLALGKAVEGKGTEDDGVTKLLEIPLPDGYQAVGYQWQWQGNLWSGGTMGIHILPEPIDNRVGSIVLAVKTRRMEAFTVSIAIHCQRTQRSLDDWKLKTHAAILQAYLKLVRDYEERLAALEVQAAQQIQGRNPLENERLIRTELKKGAISVFTEQHYDLFGAITVSPQGYPQANLPEAAAEGKYIRFFEQAFEWEQMMFFYYPYFWGRKANWLKRALLQDVDPLFADFIKAGSARVVVSVRPGFERAIAHFLDTGEIWDGGDLPDITSPLYLSIIEEIRERDKAPGAEVPQGDPWDVRLPTTLVRIRDKASLPEWKKNAQGEWLPV